MNRIAIESARLLGLAVVATFLFDVCRAAQDTPVAPTPTNRPAAAAAQNTARLAPEVLPGNGLAQHDFFYAGEAGILNMYIVRKGKVDWSYTHPAPRGEISDATLLSNGNVLFARQFGVTEITADKKVIWNYDAPAGFEVHTAQAIGKEHVVFVQNGDPAKVMVVNIVTGATEKEFVLPVGNAKSTHGQFRHARLTDTGTLLVAHLDMGKVCEYDVNGKEVWSLNVPTPWTATPLKNGNILVTNERRHVREVNRKGETVWEFQPAELPDFTISGMQTAIRSANGNTLINNWRPKGNGTAVQIFEVTPEKKLVWALRSWTEPDLGQSTTIQLLDEPGVPENVRFGDFK